MINTGGYLFTDCLMTKRLSSRTKTLTQIFIAVLRMIFGKLNTLLQASFTALVTIPRRLFIKLYKWYWVASARNGNPGHLG